METGAIAYRVADFLKQHAPFHGVEEADLLALAGGGRVRFHEPNEYILWQGEPHRHQLFVIQQGTVSLWDESAEVAKLRDVRGAGDMLGTERYNDAPACVYSARSESEVVIYAFVSTIGLTTVFSVGIVGMVRFDDRRRTGRGGIAYALLAAVCALIVAGAVVEAIVIMTRK